jgi:hypothetical protein
MNPERVQAANRGDGWRWRLKHKYGMTPDQFARMVEEQEGLCYLCGEPLALEYKRAVHIDHDHSCCRGDRSCGRCIRGVACEPCNKGIGHFGDSPERMRRAADRLEAANTRLAAELAAAPVQDELPINVRRLGRTEEESA